MYLREMGSVELLSREGEIAIAKRIEAGREKMIGSLCESSLTMRAIARWHDSLEEGEILLRDIIDLDSTYGAAYGTPPQTAANTDQAENNVGTKDIRADDSEMDGDTNSEIPDEDDGDEDDEVSVSLAAMEMALKPEILEKFGKLGLPAKLHRAQDKRRNDSVGRKFQNLGAPEHRKNLMALMEGVHSFANRTVSTAVDHRRSSPPGSHSMRILSCGVDRKNFMENYLVMSCRPTGLPFKKSRKRLWQSFVPNTAETSKCCAKKLVSQ